MKKDIIKYGLLGIGVFGLVVLGNVAAQAVYTRTKIGTDAKALSLSIIGGIACGGLVLYTLKK